jgi:alpha-L-fucosidase 2
MNYWIAEMTNMNVIGPLFDYFEVCCICIFPISMRFDSSGLCQKNWAPRGSETAHVLYNISRGWVTHNEVSFHSHGQCRGYLLR